MFIVAFNRLLQFKGNKSVPSSQMFCHRNNTSDLHVNEQGKTKNYGSVQQ